MTDQAPRPAPTVWLPIPPAEIEGLPEGPEYVFWNGEPDFPADPARAEFYAVPYMQPAEVTARPLPRMTRLRVVQTLSAGVDHVTPTCRDSRPAYGCATPGECTRRAPPS